MRLDKYLKVSRIIKRRSVASEACDSGRVSINGKVSKPSAIVKIDDVIEIRFGNTTTSVKVLSIKDSTKKEDAASLYAPVQENDNS